MISHNCPHCGTKLMVPDEYAGKTGRCKQCGNSILLPPILTEVKDTSKNAVPPRTVEAKRNAWKVASIIAFLIIPLAFVAGRETIKYQIRRSMRQAQAKLADAIRELPSVEEQGSHSSAPPPSAVFNGPMKPDKDATEPLLMPKKFNDEIVTKTYKVRITGAGEYGTLNSPYGRPALAKPRAKFVVVSMTISNQLKTQIRFLPDFKQGGSSTIFRLVDAQGREFQTYGDSIMKLANYLNMRELSPGVEESGNLVYEVPERSRTYSLVVLDEANNTLYSVPLKNS